MIQMSKKRFQEIQAWHASTDFDGVPSDIVLALDDLIDHVCMTSRDWDAIGQHNNRVRSAKNN